MAKWHCLESVALQLLPSTQCILIHGIRLCNIILLACASSNIPPPSSLRMTRDYVDEETKKEPWLLAKLQLHWPNDWFLQSKIWNCIPIRLWRMRMMRWVLVVESVEVQCLLMVNGEFTIERIHNYTQLHVQRRAKDALQLIWWDW